MDDERAFVSSYPVLIDVTVLQRTPDLREGFNTVRWIICAGVPRRIVLPLDQRAASTPHSYP
jgi:hypothetical protein